MALSINSSTGVIDTSASTPGTYVVFYTTADGTASTKVTIEDCFTNTRSLDLDGQNDYAQTNSLSALQGASSCTVMCWVRFDQTAYLEAMAFQWVNPNYLYLLRWFNGQFQFYIRSSSNTSHNVSHTLAATTNTWFHVAGVKDGTTLRLYINGSQVATTTGVPATMKNNSTGPDRISGYGSHYLGGQVDEVALWTTALSASDISTIYNSGNGAIDLASYNPVSWWRMEEGTGQSVADSGSGNRPLSLYNGATFSTEIP